MALFPARARNLLGPGLSPWGEVFPPRSNPRSLTIDGRTAALRVLREYITDLTFYRAGDKSGGPPVAFQVKPENFHIEWPDNVVDMVTPSIVVVQGANADYAVVGLDSYVEEDTVDAYAPGTVLQWQSEYTETFNLEIWASSKAERRAIIAGLEVALVPTEQMYGVRFRMPEYFDELVCFTLQRRRLMDTDSSARNRRIAQLEIEMRHNVVALVNYAPMMVQSVVQVDVDYQGVEVEIDPGDPNAGLVPDPPDPNVDPAAG